MPYLDIHSHNMQDTDNIVRIVALEHADDVPSSGFFSIAIHPWAFSSDDFHFRDCMNELEQKASFPNVIAIGESGIDRCRKLTLPQQTESFIEHIGLSESLHKPLIIHSVRSTNDILFLHKRFRPSQPWIIHGFNGKKDEILQLVSHGIFLSVGALILNTESSVRHNISFIPPEQMFLETDTSDIPISDIYSEVFRLTSFSITFLQETVLSNFNRCFPSVIL